MQAWLYQRFHVSYLLSWCAVGLLTGLLFSLFFKLDFSWGWLTLALILAVISLVSRRWYACLTIVLVGFLLGTLRGSSFGTELSKIQQIEGKNTIISGVLSQDPVQKKESSIWQVQLNQITHAELRYQGEIYGTVVSDTGLSRGDRLELKATMRPGFGGFQLTFYKGEVLSRRPSNDVFLKARDGFAVGVRRVTPEPEASLGLGFLVGQKASLPDDLADQLKVVGLTHVVVASGYNLTILVRFARRFLAKKSRYLALAGSALLVAAFVATSGLSPSMNRASVVTGLSLLAWYYGRKFHPVQLILYVASLSAMLYPIYVWSDIGWLLSFTAFFGVLVVSPILVRLFTKKDDKVSPFGQLVVETMSAQLMTLPIIVAVFGYLPVLALLANLLVAPVIPFAMLTTFWAGLVGLILPATTWLALPAGLVVAYVVAITGWLANIPWAQLEISLPTWIWLLWYGLLVAVLVIIWRRKSVDLRSASVVD